MVMFMAGRLSVSRCDVGFIPGGLAFSRPCFHRALGDQVPGAVRRFVRAKHRLQRPRPGFGRARARGVVAIHRRDRGRGAPADEQRGEELKRKSWGFHFG